MRKECKNEGFILEIDSDGRLTGTVSNSARFTVSHIHYVNGKKERERGGGGGGGGDSQSSLKRKFVS
jgi:hypothetical protein